MKRLLILSGVTILTAALGCRSHKTCVPAPACNPCAPAYSGGDGYTTMPGLQVVPGQSMPAQIAPGPETYTPVQ